MSDCRRKTKKQRRSCPGGLLALQFLPTKPHFLLMGHAEVRSSLHVGSRRGRLCHSGPLGGANEQLPGPDASGESDTQNTHKDASSSEPDT